MVFKKLMTKLTLFNLLIIGIVVFMIAIFAFIGSPKNDIESVNITMLDVALSGEVPINNNKTLGQLHLGQGGLIYLLVDDAGTILELQSQIELSSDGMEELVTIALEQTENSGEINSDYGSFLYLKMYLSPSEEQIIVLQQRIGFWESLISFASRIGPIFLVIILLVFLASMAITAKAFVPIRKAWESQVQFTADASHELRTPLAVISTNLEAATDEPQATIEEKQRWLNNIHLETKRMTVLVDDLLTLSRSDSGEKSLDKTTFVLDEAIKEAMEPLLPVAEKEKIKLNCELQENLMINADKERIKQLVIILVDNAMKYSEGTLIEVSAIKVDHNIEITISDNGVGIEKNHIEKLFDRFYRVDKARTHEQGGSGLGLAIAKWIVEEHGGSIRMFSSQSNGTKFIIELKKIGVL